MARATGRPAMANSTRSKAKKPGAAVVSEHQIRQRRHILSHAAKLFAETGYAATTMDMLAEVTQMNKASLYYYFGSKQEILFELSRQATLDGIEMALPATKMKTARDGIMHLIQAGVKNMYSRQNESKIIQQEMPYFSQTLTAAQHKELLDLRRQYMKIVYEVIKQGIESGEFRDHNVRLTGILFASWVTSPMQVVSMVSQEEMTQTLVDLFMPGLCMEASNSDLTVDQVA